MKYRHYAPKGELTIVDGESAKVVDWINAHVKEALEKGQKVGIICTDETKALYPQGVKKSVGNRQNEETVARELYRVLREFDDEGMEVMYSESFAESGIGVAIMNRLLKAAGHHVEHI